MKKIAIAAALLTTLGSGAALAQGAPPGSPSWNNSWPGAFETHQAHSTSARRTPATRSDQLAQAKVNSGRAAYQGTR